MKRLFYTLCAVFLVCGHAIARPRIRQRAQASPAITAPHQVIKSFNEPMNFVTVADSEHFPWLLVLLKSLYQFNPGKLINILLVDLGLEEKQIRFVDKQYGVKIVPLEMTHEALATKFVVRSNGRLARGWYAWKPVAMKQGFEHFSYFLYIDSGKRIVGPMDDVFNLMMKQGYFLFDCGHKIAPMTTDKVKSKFELDLDKNAWVLDRSGVEAGIQGLTRAVYDDYVYPMYQLAHNIDWFADDGTAPWGFGGSRHDQTIFSVIAQLNKYDILRVCGDGPSQFVINGVRRNFNRNNYFQFKNYADNPSATKNKLV